MASNPYNDFPCHKTADYQEDDEGDGGYVHGAKSLTCNGFLSLQCRENGIEIPGFMPHEDAFEDAYEMADRHLELWEERQS